MSGQIDPQILRIAKSLKQVCPHPRFGKDESSLQKDFAGWYDEKRSDVHIQGDSTPATELKKLRSLLDELKKTKTLLETTYEDSDAAHTYVTNVLNSSLQLVGKGIHVLPDNILASIFEELKDDMSDLRSISGVCKRFRKVLLEEPVLWTTIRNSFSLELCNAFICRSLNADLTVYMNSFWGDGHTWVENDFYKILFPGEKHRIKELFIELSQIHLVNKSKHACYSDPLSLPKLVSLSFTYGEYTRKYDPTEDLLRRLTAPTLKRFRGHATESLKNWIHQLTFCEISFKSFTEDCLEHYIKNLVQCQDLRLVITSDTSVSRQTVDGSHLFKESLRMLRSLKISLNDYYYYDRDHRRLTSTVDYLFTSFMPTEELLDLTILLLLSDASKALNALKTVLEKDYNHLKILNIVHQTSLLSEVPLNSGSMPSLEHIYVEGHGGELPTEKFSDLCKHGGFRMIKTITFKNCRNVGADYLLDIASVFSSGQYLRSFQSLSLRNCNISGELWIQLKMFLQDRFLCTPSISGQL